MERETTPSISSSRSSSPEIIEISPDPLSDPLALDTPASPAVPIKAAPRKFSIDFKLKLVEETKGASIRSTAAKYDLGESTVRGWVKKFNVSDGLPESNGAGETLEREFP